MAGQIESTNYAEYEMALIANRSIWASTGQEAEGPPTHES